MTEREQFEAWAVEERLAYRDQDGFWFYQSDNANAYWRGWQAARSTHQVETQPSDHWPIEDLLRQLTAEPASLPNLPTCTNSQTAVLADERCYAYARNLAETMWRKRFKDDAPDWKPLDDLIGVLTQIDNMVAGLVRADKAQPELGGHSQQWVRDLLFSAHFCGSSAYHCTEVRRLLAPNDDIADEVISRESTRCARHARELLADKAQPERELPAIETLKIVVRDAFMNGISWMLGNKDSRLQEQNDTADWYVQQWVTSEHNPLNYQAPADKAQPDPLRFKYYEDYAADQADKAQPAPAVDEAAFLWHAITEEAECVFQGGKKYLMLNEEMCMRLGDAIAERTKGPAPAVEEIHKALHIAFSLGQRFWQQADHEFSSENKKAYETQQKFHALVAEFAERNQGDEQ